jgi:Protein of unknown function (DUF2846)
MLETRTQHWRSVVAITLLVLGLLLSVMPPPAQTQGSPGSTPINLEHVKSIVASIPAHSQGAEQAQNQPGHPGMVYFYFTGVDMPGVIMMGTPAIEIYCDQQLVAKLKKDRFFAINVEPGRHTFASKSMRTSTKETEIELDVKSGQVSFIRIDVVIKSFKGSGYLKVVEEEEGRLAVSRLKPLEASDVRDQSRVVTVKP